MTFLATLAAVYVIVVLGMYAFQRSFLYFPDRRQFNPTDVGLEGVQAVSVHTNDNETLQAWYAPAEPGRPVVLHFHGNAGSISDRSDRLRFFQRQGLGALFVSYRGYGASSGTPSEEGLINDALASHQWLLERNIEARDIVVVGESLGAAVAVQLASQRSVGTVILEAPFTSAVDVAKAHYWWLPVSLLMKDRYQSIDLINNIGTRLLIVHGENDEVTSASLGQRLFDAAAEPKQLMIVKNAAHNDLYNPAIWQDELNFIED